MELSKQDKLAILDQEILAAEAGLYRLEVRGRVAKRTQNTETMEAVAKEMERITLVCEEMQRIRAEIDKSEG